MIRIINGEFPYENFGILEDKQMTIWEKILKAYSEEKIKIQKKVSIKYNPRKTEENRKFHNLVSKKMKEKDIEFHKENTINLLKNKKIALDILIENLENKKYNDFIKLVKDHYDDNFCVPNARSFELEFLGIDTQTKTGLCSCGFPLQIETQKCLYKILKENSNEIRTTSL